MLNGVRSLVHVNRFAARVLRGRRWWRSALVLMLFALGLWLAYRDYSEEAWIAFGAGIVGLAREAWPALVELFGSPRFLLERDDEFVRRTLGAIGPSREEERDGFVVERAPHRWDEAVLRSPRVDRWLRGAAVRCTVEDRKRDAIEARLRQNAGDLENMLRCRARESFRSEPSRVFFNGSKFGLAEGVAIGDADLRCHRIEYFHSVLTNEAVTRRLVADDGDARATWGGASAFPAAPDVSSDAPKLRLLPIAHSGMADHVGVSTLVVTRDRKLVLWNQSGRAMHSRNLMAPTGSGSCDWKDAVFTGSGHVDLHATLARAMEREFLEESFAGAAASLRRETRVLGYFRWIRRGGKPEFVGVTRADVDAVELQPNAAEVNRRGHAALPRDVPDLQKLCDVLDELRGLPGASVPLWVNARVLREAIDENPAEWASFLGLPSGDAGVPRTSIEEVAEQGAPPSS